MFAMPPVPRPAKDFTVTQTAGQKITLSEHRGKVVLMQFLYTTCVHCQATARTFSKLEAELGPQGLQVVGIAFNEDALTGPGAVEGFVTANHVSFPVGTASRESVMGYLGLSVMERFVVPQIVVVDRKGNIRAQSEPLGTEQLQDEAYMRKFLQGLLQEGKPTSTR
jgi:peroxiredoxin